MKDFYAVLGVLPTAENVVIRAAYKALAQRYHPDKYQGTKVEAEALMKELNRPLNFSLTPPAVEL